jgi:hypothetical protein
MRGRDNSQAGRTGETKLEAYKLDGHFIWRINLGKNIREGAHYTQFMVYDLDGDGKAEVVCKTADGTGTPIGDAARDHRNASGFVLEGHGNRISKWNWQESSETRLVTAESCESKTWDTTSRPRQAFTWATACRSSPGPRS